MFDFGVELPVVEDEMVMHSMFNLGESLAVFGVSEQRTCIWVWVMAENLSNNPWSLWFSGDSNLDTSRFFSKTQLLLYKKLFYDESTSTFIVVYKSTTILFVVYNYYNHEYDEPMSYNIITREIRRLRESTAGLRIKFADTYVESLALCSGR